MKKILSFILIIALFCGNITPVYAGEKIMLSENSGEKVVSEKEIFGEEILEEKDEVAEKFDSEIFDEDVLQEKDILTEEVGNVVFDKEISEEREESTVETEVENNCLEEEKQEEKNTESEEITVEEDCYLNENLDEETFNVESISDNLLLWEEEKQETVSENIPTEEISATSAETASEKVFALKIQGKEAGSYAKWSDVVTAVSEVANTTEEYIVEISESVDIEETLTIPGKIGRLIIRGKNSKEQALLSVVGDIKLSSDLMFENIELKSKKYNDKTKTYDEYFATIALNGKELQLNNSAMKNSSIKGKAGSVLALTGSEIVVKNVLSGVEKVSLKNASLKVKTANITSELEMESSALEGEGKITVKNLCSKDANNRIIYQNNVGGNGLTVTGNVTSKNIDEEAQIVWKNEAEGEKIEEIVKIRKNAIDLEIKSLEEVGYATGDLLANISKAGSVWFVVGSKWETRNGEKVRVVKGVTYKANNKLYFGTASKNVLLSSSDADDEESFLLEGGFATLQEAFNEINKKANTLKYYRILINNGEDNVATFSGKNLKFPTKSKGILIRKSSNIQDGNLYFKGNLSLGCDVKFEDIIFRNTGKTVVSLGKYTLKLKNCYSNDNSEAVAFDGITGNGVKNTSKLVLDDTLLKVKGNVNNVGTVEFAGEPKEEVVTSSAEEVFRIVPAYPEVMAYGKINIGNVSLETDGKITGMAKIIRKSGAVTKLTSGIIINGEVASTNSSNLFLDLQEKIGKEFSYLNFDTEEMEVWKQEKGIPLAKAITTAYPNVFPFRNSKQVLTKQNGHFTYYESGMENGKDFYGVELSFEKEGKTEIIYCRSFADAVTEINNRKIKRDYIITLKKKLEDILFNSPQKLTFPNKKYINSLVLQGEEDVKLAYVGGITFTSPVTLKNINFVQMVKQSGVYKKVKEVKSDYPAVVTIKTGGFDLSIEGKIEFDVPIKIDGGSKGSLFLNGKLITDTNDCDEKTTKDRYVLYGMLTNIHTLSLNEKELSLREIKNKRNSTKYTSSSNKISNLYLCESEVEVLGTSGKNSLNVQNVLLQNSKIKVEGNGIFKNITMEGTKEAVVSVDKTFNITGILGVNTDNSRLETRRKGNGKEPYLNISGKLVRKENINPIYVGVYYENSAGELLKDKAVRLSDAPKATGQLLAAKYALASDFRPIDENYPAGEYSEENTNGYICVKKNGKIYVCSGEKYK